MFSFGPSVFIDSQKFVALTIGLGTGSPMPVICLEPVPRAPSRVGKR
jgi:hypothetical protein